MASDRWEQLRREALAALESAAESEALEAWRVAYLGRRGLLTQALRTIGTLPPEERPEAGALGNAVRQELEERYEARLAAIQETDLARTLAEGALDVTLPGRRPPLGRLHPTTQMLREIVGALVSLGFQVVEGPEVETDYYNFEALNMPPEHPARDMWDTLWIDPGKGILLRTHTSPVQIRTLERRSPPVRITAPGKVYRYEATDATHESIFYQVEGLVVGVGVTFAALKGTLTELARRIFGRQRRTEFRCAYFPFVEPGVEVAIDCFRCGGAGCRTCGQAGWIEVLGAGMVHPKVLAGMGLDPRHYSGYAFGIGVERFAMLKYGIEDIRLFYSNDLRFLHQF